MKKQLQIGFAAVVILLVLESLRALTGTLGQIEIRIVTEDRSTEVVDEATASPGSVSVEPVSPTPTLRPSKAQSSLALSSPVKSSPVTVWPTSTSERPEFIPSSTPRITFTPVPTGKPVWRKYIPPSMGSSKNGSSGAAAYGPTGNQVPMPTSAPTSVPLPTSAPPDAPNQAPTDGTDAFPTSAPPPADS